MTELDEADRKSGDERNRIIKRYIDPCDEELFYFKRNYIPSEIINEWLEGMVGYLPVFCGDGKLANPRCKLQSVMQTHLLEGYPRSSKAFKVSKRYDLSNDSERKAMISEIRNNIKRMS